MTTVKKVQITILFILLVSIGTITRGYSYFDTLEDTQSETATIGTWDLVDYVIGPIFVNEFQSAIDDEILNDPTSNLGYIYDQINAPTNVVEKINNIDVFGYSWTFWTKAKTENYTTFGYPVLIDRELDVTNNPIHDINPAYSATALYPGYNYFTAYDSLNTLTNNQYSLRLNYNMRMTSSTKVGNVTNISFYAMLGLSDPDDTIGMRETQKLYVEVSATNSNWTKIGQQKPTQATSMSEAYTFYSYDVPASLLGQNLYVRIRYNGRALTVNGEILYGRLVLDELIITTS